MNDNPIFDELALAFLEKKLWRIIENRNSSEELPPHVSSLLLTDACEAYQIDLAQYAWDMVHDDVNKWKGHPFLEHLSQCTICSTELKRMTDFYRRTPSIRRLSKTDIDITIFYKDIIPQRDEGIRGERLTEQTMLIDAGLMEEPVGWYYALEQIHGKMDESEGILFTLSTPDGPATNLQVTIVLLGRLLRGITDENGQIFFEGITVPILEQPLTPAIVLRLHRST